MAITTVDGIVSALGQQTPLHQALQVNKASIANAVAGQVFALWRATGVPGQGAIPGAVAVCDNTLLGGLNFTNPTSVLSYLARMSVLCSNAGTYLQVHDRLTHMGGLSGTVITAQTAAVDCTVATSNMVARKGRSAYQDVQWWLEWYTDTGSTATTATVIGVYDDASAASIAISITATMRASRRMPIISNVAGRYLRSVTSVTLTASTLTAGSFGVSASRLSADLSCETATIAKLLDWAAVGFPNVNDSACLELVAYCPTTSTGTVVGTIDMVQG